MERVGGPQQAVESLRRGVEGFKDASKGSKMLQRVRRCFKGFEDISRDVRGFKEVRRALKGCPMTITPPSRLWQLDAMGVPGWGSICGGEGNVFEAEVVNQARGTRVRMVEGGNSIRGVEVSGGFP